MKHSTEPKKQDLLKVVVFYHLQVESVINMVKYFVGNKAKERISRRR